MTSRTHFDAFKARLVADATLSVHDTIAPRNTDGTLLYDAYVIVFGGGAEMLDDERATAPNRVNSTVEYVYTTRSVAPDPAGCRSVHDHVATQVAGYVLTIAGRSCRPIRLTGGDANPLADDSVRKPLYFMDDEWTLVTDPT